jgi:hypothetical protein
MSVSPEYMKLLQEFTNFVKAPKTEAKDAAENMLARIEEYREDHPKIPGHTQRSLDRMENSCRERLGMPLLKRTILEKIVQKLS